MNEKAKTELYQIAGFEGAQLLLSDHIRAWTFYLWKKPQYEEIQEANAEAVRQMTRLMKALNERKEQ